MNSETPAGHRLKRESLDDDKASGLYDENDLEVAKRMIGKCWKYLCNVIVSNTSNYIMRLLKFKYPYVPFC